MKTYKTSLKMVLTSKTIQLKFNKILLISLSTLLSIGVANSNNWSIEDDIQKSTLIVKGSLLSKSSKLESIPRYMRNGNREIISTIPQSIFTTYVFEVEEILKGKIKENNIKVLMLGGCKQDNSECVEYSFNYKYNIGDEAVLFLTFNETTQAYKATEGIYSTYTINQDNILIRKDSYKGVGTGDTYYRLYNNESSEEVREQPLTFDELRTKIAKFEKQK